MKVTLIEEDVVDRLVNKIDKLEKHFEEIVNRASYPLKERWVSNEEAIEVLKCSKRTLQSYRETYVLPFTRVKAKIYYKATDIEKFLIKNYRTIVGF
jgi:hypothetical protein